MLTQERVKELFEYSDGKLIRKIRTSNNVKVGSEVGCMDAHGYRSVHINGRLYKLHRLIFLYHYGYLPENDVDHIDRDKNNNRIENLREVSRSCNLKNCKSRSDNTSGVVGICFQNSAKKWCVQIGRYKQYIGIFSDFTEAVAHRLAAEQCLGWEGCHSSTSAYLYMKEYLNETRREVS